MRSQQLSCILLSLMFLMLACTKTDEASNQNSPGSAAQEAQDQPSPVDQWTVSETGIGRVKIGMTVAEASESWGSQLAALGDIAPCYYVKPGEGPSGISFMVVDGRIARINVENASIATSAGARVGDSAERVKTLYPNQVEIMPHKYTEGHYLTVTPTDSAYRIIFETDGKKVIRFRAGKMPEVQWVEGCS